MPLDTEVIEIRKYMERLWPILRSITGGGARETHQILSELMPLETMEIPSGHEFFDWTVPPEWVFHKEVLTGPDGQMICDATLTGAFF
jgi:aminopeptidase-like protein